MAAGLRPGVRVLVKTVNRTRARLPAGRLAAAAGLALKSLKAESGGRPISTTLVCVGGRRMRDYNRQFTGRETLTDVLSFEEREYDPEEKVFRAGDVIICTEAARRESRRRSVRFKDELLLYAIHGWLHLAGFRDKTAQQRRKMVAAERRIMGRLGLRRDG